MYQTILLCDRCLKKKKKKKKTQLSKLLLAKKETHKLEEELKNLEREANHSERDDGDAESGFQVDSVDGVSPLATHFENIRTPVLFSSVCEGIEALINEKNTRSHTKEKITVILDRIQREKLCCDEDGRQIFTLLTRVKIRTNDIQSILLTSGSPWSCADDLQASCERESVGFSVRAFILFPSASLLIRAFSGDIGVLEFVEILLKTWQLDSNSNKENSPTHAKKIQQINQQRLPVCSSVP